MANIMSCLRSDEAFSICSSSANANNSAGDFRLSSWRFIEDKALRQRAGPELGRTLAGIAERRVKRPDVQIYRAVVDRT
jgi:hypothetical protein